MADTLLHFLRIFLLCTASHASLATTQLGFSQSIDRGHRQSTGPGPLAGRRLFEPVQPDPPHLQVGDFLHARFFSRAHPSAAAGAPAAITPAARARARAARAAAAAPAPAARAAPARARAIPPSPRPPRPPALRGRGAAPGNGSLPRISGPPPERRETARSPEYPDPPPERREPIGASDAPGNKSRRERSERRSRRQANLSLDRCTRLISH